MGDKPESAFRDGARVELLECARVGVSGVGEGFFAGFGAALVEVVKGAIGHKDLAADLKQAGGRTGTEG